MFGLCRSFTRPLVRGPRPINTEKPFSSKKCLAWFHKYAAPDKVFGPEAMEKFCEDIGVEPENVSQQLLVTLHVPYLMNSWPSGVIG